MPPPLQRSEVSDNPLFGSDTSRYQGVALDPELMKQAGCAYWLMKATRGLPATQEYHQDPLFAETRKRAAEAGLVISAYHFLNYDNPRDQVHRYVEFMDKTGGTKDMLHIVDFEESPPGTGGPEADATYEHL